MAGARRLEMSWKTMTVGYVTALALWRKEEVYDVSKRYQPTNIAA